MRHTMVTYTVKPGREEENAALVRAVLEELTQTRPAGFRYAVFHADSRQFVHLYTDEGSTSGLQTLASFQGFTAGAKDRHEQPASFTQLELLGDYRTFDDPDRSASGGGPVPATVSTVGENEGVQADMRAGL
jgi:hypothetical protein